MIEMRTPDTKRWPQTTGSMEAVTLDNAAGKRFFINEIGGAAFLRDHICNDIQNGGTQFSAVRESANRRHSMWPLWLKPPLIPGCPQLDKAYILDLTSRSAVLRGVFVALDLDQRHYDALQVRDFHLTDDDFKRFITEWAPQYSCAVFPQPRAPDFHVADYDVRR